MGDAQAFGYVGSIPEHLTCPICFEVPKCEVYQCVDGHVMCNFCFRKLSVCSSCRKDLDKTQPIRNRHFEQQLDEFNVHCSFKCNGCKKIVKKGLLASHQANCCFNFDKFGKFVNLCKSIGFSQCNFKMNNGNTKEGVNHLVSQHGCKLLTLAKGERFEMELANFQKLQKMNDNQSWTPVIADWKDEKYYLLSISILLCKTNLGFFSLFLPYPEKVVADRSLKTCANFLIENGKSRAVLKQMPATLKNYDSFLDDFNFPLCVAISSSAFQSFNKKGSLIVACNEGEFETGTGSRKNQNVLCAPMRAPLKSVAEKTSPLKTSKPAGKRSLFDSITAKCRKKIKEFLCLWITLGIFASALGSVWLSYKIFTRTGPHIGHELEENWHKMKLVSEKDFNEFTARVETYMGHNRTFSLTYLKALFDQEQPGGITNDIMRSLRRNAIFLTAKSGTIEANMYLIKKKFHHEMFLGRNLLFWTVMDNDKRIGFEKTKLLVNHGLSTKLVDDYKKNLLHHAAHSGSDTFVEYYLINGVEPNWRDFEGLTPLHHVFNNKNPKFWAKSAELLLEYGADPLLRGHNGLSALQMAENSGNEDVIDIFRKYEWMTTVSNPRYFLSGSKAPRMCSNRIQP